MNSVVVNINAKVSNLLTNFSARSQEKTLNISRKYTSGFLEKEVEAFLNIFISSRHDNFSYTNKIKKFSRPRKSSRRRAGK